MPSALPTTFPSLFCARPLPLLLRLVCGSCKRKYKGYINHCQNQQLTRCSSVCNATSPESIRSCQQALAEACSLVTSPSGARYLEEEGGPKEVLLAAGPVRLVQTAPVDSCASTSALSAFIDAGGAVAVVRVVAIAGNWLTCTGSAADLILLHFHRMQLGHCQGGKWLMNALELIGSSLP